MNNNTKIDLQSRAASRRFSKGTVCSILKGNDIVNFIIRNNLLPSGLLITHPEKGFSSDKNRVMAIPKYNMSEFISEYKIFTGESIIDPKSREESARFISREQAGQALVSFLEQNLILIHISNSFNIKVSINDLDKYDVLIESIDVLGTVSGILVPMTKEDSNNNNVWNK